MPAWWTGAARRPAWPMSRSTMAWSPTSHAAGSAGDCRPQHRRRWAAAHPRLGRRPHALRRAGVVGSVSHPVVVARRHLGRDGQLRRRFRTGRTRSARVADRADGRCRGHPRLGDDRRHHPGSGRASRSSSTRSMPATTPSTSGRRSPTVRFAATSWATGAQRTKPPLPATSTAMAAIVESGLRAGALGFSTSRTPLHKSLSGELVPGTHAGADELLGIADALGRVGHGVFQFAPDHVDVPTSEMPWMREIARRTGRTVSVNLNQPNSAPDLWREVLDQLDESRAEGLDIVAQVAGRVVGLLMCLEGSFNPLDFHPAYGPYSALPLDERVAALQSPELREAIAGRARRRGPLPQGRARLVDSWWAVDDGDIDYEPEADDSIAAVARRTGAHPIDLDRRPTVRPRRPRHDPHAVLQLCVRRPVVPVRGASAPIHAHGPRRRRRALPRDLRRRHPDVHAHALDARPPPGPTLPLEQIVHRQTRQTAELYGLGDRGLVAPGMRADLNLIDYDRLTFGPPRMAYDLPGGRPPARAEGRRLRRNVRQRRPDRRRRRVHRRTPRTAHPRPSVDPAPSRYSELVRDTSTTSHATPVSGPSTTLNPSPGADWPGRTFSIEANAVPIRIPSLHQRCGDEVVGRLRRSVGRDEHRRDVIGEIDAVDVEHAHLRDVVGRFGSRSAAPRRSRSRHHRPNRTRTQPPLYAHRGGRS